MLFGQEDHGAQRELVIARAGLGPVYAEAATRLGILSATAERIESTQAGIEKSLANEILLREIVDLLPQATGEYTKDSFRGRRDLGVFEFGGENQQYLARQLQANAMWLPTELNYIFGKANVWMPCYIAGRRRTSEVHLSDVELLLIPAGGISEGVYKKDSYHKPKIVAVNAADLNARDNHAFAIIETEFTEEQSSAMISQSCGRFIVNSASPGSIFLRARGKGETTLQNISSKGVRYDKDKTTTLDHGIPDEILDQFEVDTAFANLTTAFGVDEDYDAILVSEHPQDALLVTREQRLVRQNRDLREAFGAVLLAFGMLSEDEVRHKIDQRFPQL